MLVRPIEAIFGRIIILTCVLTLLIYGLNLSATPSYGPFRQSSIRSYFCGRGRELLLTESTFR